MICGGIYGMIISPEEGGLMNGETYEPNTPDLHIHDKASRVINLLVPAVQTTGHIIAGSVTLRSEALHNLIDFALKLISHVTILLGE